VNAGAQTINFTNYADATRVWNAQFAVAGDTHLNEGLHFAYAPNTIPEPGVGILAGVAGTLALLRRKRQN
jgi:hypothetical protein